jgi:indole-3-glycerol phosphate synthase/phosphoribosylanthranilate isomerase
MASILDRIVAAKRAEIAQLHRDFDMDALRQSVQPTPFSFYERISEWRARQAHFFICEFKRKSPSEGWIYEHADVSQQVLSYASAGAGAISVLTDFSFFGGSYADLTHAAQALAVWGENRPLLLQKDFVLDPIQIYLARQAGADMILLIAAILEPQALESLRLEAARLGMGALVEVHDATELAAIQHLEFPVLGVNNRDLGTFRTSLNRANVVAAQANGRWVIAESGVHNYRDFRCVDRADGFLIGTSLMRATHAGQPLPLQSLLKRRPLFKACGIRSLDLLATDQADFVGLNFSPKSKRRINESLLEGVTLPDHAVAVFYQNSTAEMERVLETYGFKRFQVYADDVSLTWIRQQSQRAIIAGRIRQTTDIDLLLTFAADADFLILDGATPGSGQPIDSAVIPADFPYPFLLAGGLNRHNVKLIEKFKHCIGVDVASGIETNGEPDPVLIAAIAGALV